MARRKTVQQNTAPEEPKATASEPKKLSKPAQEEPKKKTTAPPLSKKEQKKPVRDTSATQSGVQRPLDPQPDPSLQSNHVRIEGQPAGRAVDNTQRPPLVNIQGNLKLDGVWNLRCYEYQYVTECLQLHRFPTDPTPTRNESQAKKGNPKSSMVIKDGWLIKRSVSGPDDEGEPTESDNDYFIDTAGVTPGQRSFKPAPTRAHPNATAQQSIVEHDQGPDHDASGTIQDPRLAIEVDNELQNDREDASAHSNVPKPSLDVEDELRDDVESLDDQVPVAFGQMQPAQRTSVTGNQVNHASSLATSASVMDNPLVGRSASQDSREVVPPQHLSESQNRAQEVSTATGTQPSTGHGQPIRGIRDPDALGPSPSADEENVSKDDGPSAEVELSDIELMPLPPRPTKQRITATKAADTQKTKVSLGSLMNNALGADHLLKKKQASPAIAAIGPPPFDAVAHQNGPDQYQASMDRRISAERAKSTSSSKRKNTMFGSAETQTDNPADDSSSLSSVDSTPTESSSKRRRTSKQPSGKEIMHVKNEVKDVLENAEEPPEESPKEKKSRSASGRGRAGGRSRR